MPFFFSPTRPISILSYLPVSDKALKTTDHGPPITRPSIALCEAWGYVDRASLREYAESRALRLDVAGSSKEAPRAPCSLIFTPSRDASPWMEADLVTGIWWLEYCKRNTGSLSRPGCDPSCWLTCSELPFGELPMRRLTGPGTETLSPTSLRNWILPMTGPNPPPGEARRQPQLAPGSQPRERPAGRRTQPSHAQIPDDLQKLCLLFVVVNIMVVCYLAV